MLVQVYRYAGYRSRSIVSATLVTEVEVDEMPDDQISFAEEYGGDFIEVTYDYFYG